MEEYLDHIFDQVDPSIHLDQEQKEVVIKDGDLLVIAGAGSGKTTTMVAKVKYLIDMKKVDPKSILLISYTNKATEELKMRIHQEFQLKIDILTFHKLGLQLIKKKRKVEIKTEGKEFIKNIINKREHEWVFRFFTRKYRNKKDWSKFILLSENFIKNYKLKGNPSIEQMKLSKFWKHYFLNLIQEYNQWLRQNHWIDFEDMILEATIAIEKREVLFPYQYVIVDEYQDISKDRFLLLQAIKKNYSSTIIVVGDDWQSIFGFSGSEMRLFTEFPTFFKEANVLKITNTYRNSQELIDIAGNFVMKNPIQIKKQLRSLKHVANPIQFFPYQKSPLKELETILKRISNLKKNATVFLLGRYHHDLKIEEFPFLKKENNQIKVSFNPDLIVDFLTVHSAKGLGADEVILLNCTNDIYGFPTKKKTDPILKNVETIDQSYPYAEERRLFYVALTRTKNHVFILYPKKSPSVFLKELFLLTKK